MAKKPASVQLTGGAGYEFEDQVAAYFVSAMLTGIQLFGPKVGAVVQLDWQVRESGWLLDDLLVTLAGPTRTRLALSIKSDRQVTTSGFPEDFVTDVWTQWLGQGIPKSDFDRDADLLGLVVGELAAEVEQGWNDFLRQSLTLTSESSRLSPRLTTEGISSAAGRNLYASLKCPVSVPSPSKDTEPAAIVSRLQLLHLDFTSPTSRDRARVITDLQRALRSGSASEAGTLWEALCRVCSVRRSTGGSLSRPALLAEVIDQFALRDVPNLEAAWARLALLSGECARHVKTELTGGVRVDNAQARREATVRLREERAVILAGPSGSGKSALARSIAEDAELCARFLWLDAASIGDATPTELASRWGLSCDLRTVLGESTSDSSVLVLDGLDRFTDKGLATVAELLAALSKPLERSGWAVLATCQSDSLSDLQTRLAQIGLAKFFDVFPVDAPAEAAIMKALAQAPGASRLASEPSVVNALRNLKVFDWVVSALRSAPGQDTSALVGTTSVLDWIWSGWTSKKTGKPARDGVLKRLGSADAESLALGVGLSAFDSSDRLIIEELRALDLVRIDRERVYFTHDFVGDLARFRQLIEVYPDMAALVARARNPRWHPAVRLLGQRLAEQSTDTARAWSDAVEPGSDSSSESTVCRDLFVEGVCRAANVGGLLESLWPDLTAKNGELLKRVLRAFHRVATVPKYPVPANGDGADAAVRAHWEARVRFPLSHHWPPVLAVLAKHADEVGRLARREAAQIVGLWLREMPVGMPGRSDAAAIALAVAKAMQVEHVEFHGSSDSEDVDTCLALLNASPERPDDVAQICLELARRRPDPARVIERRRQVREAERKRREDRASKIDPDLFVTPTLGFGYHGDADGVVSPDGPTEAVDRSFQKAVLSGNAINTLAAFRPAVAQEILLACSLKPPVSKGSGRHPLNDECGIETPDQSDLPFYWQGPWLNLLRLNAELGASVIIRLVNHATRVWAYLDDEGRPLGRTSIEVPSARVSTEGAARQWVGDFRIFCWYRDQLVGAHTLVSALMALEFHLYELTDSGRSIEPITQRIWREGASVALLGPLAALAVRNPALLDRQLSPLLGIWQLHGWSDQMILNEDVWQIGAMQWERLGETVFELYRSWNTLLHRKTATRDVFARALWERPAIQTAFVTIRERWAEEAKQHPESEVELRQLSALFDIRNYTMGVSPEGIPTPTAFTPPADLAEAAQREVERGQQQYAWLSFPRYCRKWLAENRQLTDEQASSVWQNMVRLSAIEDEEDDPGPLGPVRQREDIIAGGVAVLSILTDGWLSRNDEQQRWCRTEIEKIYAKPPATAPLDDGRSRSTDKWYIFLGELAISQLARIPEDTSARAMAAWSIASHWHTATKVAMLLAWRLREGLGDDFRRLVHLVAMWAALEATRHHFNETDAERGRCQSRRVKLVSAFVERRLPVERLNWKRIGRIGQRAFDRLDRKRWSQRYGGDGRGSRRPARYDGKIARAYAGYDLEILEAGFGWLSAALADAGEVKELGLETLRELLSLVTDSLSTDIEPVEEDHEIEGNLYEFDMWVFDLTVQAIMDCEDAESAAQLWRPVLSLGSRSHYWVESFLERWHSSALRHPSPRERYFARWNDMIEWARSSETWSASKGAGWQWSDQLWQVLLGMGIGRQVVAAQENEPSLKQMVPVYERWAKERLDDRIRVTSFCEFLMLPGARPLRLPAVSWLLDYRKKAGAHEQREVDGPIAQVLILVWNESSQQVAGDLQAKQRFLELVSLLAAGRDPISLQLRDRVAGKAGRA